jgi:hypothetical protein
MVAYRNPLLSLPPTSSRRIYVQQQQKKTLNQENAFSKVYTPAERTKMTNIKIEVIKRISR